MGQGAWEPSPGKLSLFDVVLGTDVLGFGALVPGDRGITPPVGKQEEPKEQPSNEGPLDVQGTQLGGVLVCGLFMG